MSKGKIYVVGIGMEIWKISVRAYRLKKCRCNSWIYHLYRFSKR